jgi:hypothetical protein
MCCPGDEYLVQSAQQESKEDTGYDSPTALSREATSAVAHSGTSTILSSGHYYTGTSSCDSTSPLMSPVKRPAKSTDQLEKEYLENIAALTDRDEEEWQETLSLLAMDRLDNELSQEEQRTLVIIEEYYESLRADQARREALRAAASREEHYRAIVFTQQMQRWRDKKCTTSRNT